MNPGDSDHRDLKLEPDSARMMIASALRLHKHAYYLSGRGRHLRYRHRLVAPPCDDDYDRSR